MKTKHLPSLLAALISLPACAANREVPFRPSPGSPFTGKLARYDYTTYEKIPDRPTSIAYRTVLKTFPSIRKKAFWGNWAGSGCAGGVPVDEMDEVFRRHDIAYAEASTLRTMQWADEACVEALRRLDQSKMSPEALDFYQRSSAFFANQRLTLVGKPVSSYWRFREKKDCPFQCKEDLRELFGLDKSGKHPPALKSAPQGRIAPESLVAAKAKAKSSTVRKAAVPPATSVRKLLAGRAVER